MALYFIALVPNEGLLEEISNLKQEIKDRYGPKHALKLPPHITVQAPFEMPVEQEEALNHSLNNLSRQQSRINVELNGFGAFKPRVLFLKIKDPAAIIELHEHLRQALKSFLEPDEIKPSQDLHPHITLATRDVKKDVFKVLWREFKNRTYENSFTAEDLVLFKHNGKTWDIHCRFRFI